MNIRITTNHPHTLVTIINLILNGQEGHQYPSFNKHHKYQNGSYTTVLNISNAHYYQDGHQ